MHIDNLENNIGEQGDEAPGQGEGEEERGGDGEVPDEYNRYYPDEVDYNLNNGTGQEEYM
jgi:hypothetical protein